MGEVGASSGREGRDGERRGSGRGAKRMLRAMGGGERYRWWWTLTAMMTRGSVTVFLLKPPLSGSDVVTRHRHRLSPSLVTPFCQAKPLHHHHCLKRREILASRHAISCRGKCVALGAVCFGYCAYNADPEPRTLLAKSYVVTRH